MNAHVNFLQHAQRSDIEATKAQLCAQRPVFAWEVHIGGCDEYSAVPQDGAAAGRHYAMALEDGVLVRRDGRYGSILD